MTILHMSGGRIAITCEVGQCIIRATVTASTPEDARAIVAHHNHGWYTRRQRGRIIDACQYHLGSCCIAHARPGAPGVDPAAFFPPPRLEPMSGEGAAWVRENVWPRALAASLGPIESCPCQYGPSSWCLHGNCGRCQGSEPSPMPETYVTDKTGLVPLAAGFRDGHPAVWLADRRCAWSCVCGCGHPQTGIAHAPERNPARPVTYEAVTLPGFDLLAEAS